MSNADKPEADYSATEAVAVDEAGRLRVEMEVLQKGGDDEIEGVVRTETDE